MAKAKAEDQPTGQEGHRKMKKTEAVKAALAAGQDVPLEGVAYIKKEFGLDVTPQQFSTYKSIAKAKAKEGKGGRKARAVTPRGVVVGNGMVSLNDLEAAKQLVNKVGAEQAKKLVSLFE